MQCYVLKDRVAVSVSLDEFTRDCEDRNALGVQVALTHVSSRLTVSTVFLGYDVGLSGNPAPTLFETMVFGGRYHEYRWHHQTMQEAEECHSHIVRLVRAEHDEFERIYRAGSVGC